MDDRVIPPILLVRLKVRGPDGVAVDESRRVCHLVPVPDAVPAELRAYCGMTIAPGVADVLDGMAGAPCERCLAKSPIPAFAMLRLLPPATSGAAGRGENAGWWDLGLRSEHKNAARFVLLLLLQDPTRLLTVAEITKRLEQDEDTVNLIMLLHAVVGWVERGPNQDDRAWPECSYRLTERGATLARRLLAHKMTPAFAILASGQGLDTTVVDDLPTGIEESTVDDGELG